MIDASRDEKLSIIIIIITLMIIILSSCYVRLLASFAAPRFTTIISFGTRGGRRRRYIPRGTIRSNNYIINIASATSTTKSCHNQSRMLRPTLTFRILINKHNKKLIQQHCCYSKTIKLEMDEQRVFIGRQDQYNGIIVDSTIEPTCRGSNFVNRLRESLKRWKEDEKWTIWFRVDVGNAEWIPKLIDEGFKFHHAKEDYVTLYRWLPSQLTNNVPSYAHTNLGVGGFVFNDDTDEILVVKDKRSILGGPTRWKLPGGFVDPGEDIPAAVMREVREETGIVTEFESIVGFRHSHGYAFGCSDIYVVARLKPLTFVIEKCQREIQDCAWIKLEEYANDPSILKNNRILALALLQYVKNRTGLKLIEGEHPVTKKSVSIYLLPDIHSSVSASSTHIAH